ncbi:MAG: DUF3592 domain-containing protein [Phycisphaerae bacterium]|jgi:hypothetical protein|nr:DUF3592 domain-containing protein [Phycisphaerae bacterium]
MRRRSPRAARILGLIFLIVGLSGQVVAGVLAIRTKLWLDNAVATSGTVTELDRRRSRKSTTYAEHVRFTDAAGAEHEFISGLSTSHPYSVGAVVPVRYDPNDPTSASIDTAFRNWFVPGLIFVMALVFTGIGFSIRLKK